MLYSRMTYHCRSGDAAISGNLDDDDDLTVNVTADTVGFTLYGSPATVLATLDSMRTAAEQAMAKASHPSSPDTMLFLGGSRRSFHCDCGANVFRRQPSGDYECNACHVLYRGDSADEVPSAAELAEMDRHVAEQEQRAARERCGEPPTVNEARAAGLIGVERARQAINGGAA